MIELLKKLLWGYWESGMKEATPYVEKTKNYTKREVREFNKSMKAIYEYRNY